MGRVTDPQRVEETSPPPLKTYGWRWGGRPLDLYALIVLVLTPGEVAGIFAGSGRLGLLYQLVRSLPILIVAFIVTALAVYRPEALSGKRPRVNRKKASDRVGGER